MVKPTVGGVLHLPHRPLSRLIEATDTANRLVLVLAECEAFAPITSESHGKLIAKALAELEVARTHLESFKTLVEVRS